LGGEWKNLSSAGSDTQQILFQAFDHCRTNNIKTVFYSKEDPLDYTRFLSIAKKCEFIFTTSKESIQRYRDDCGHNKVSLLLFGINPLYHNPIGAFGDRRQKGVLFSGAWYEQFPERCKVMHDLLNGVIDSGKAITIIDRNYYEERNHRCFPEKYWSHILPPLEHDVLQRTHKLFDWALGANTISFSETMFANRSFELLALGSLVLSSYSFGLSSLLPEVFISHSQEQATRILGSYDDEFLYQRRVAGIRGVMSNHDSFRRMVEVLNIVGFKADVKKRRVLVVVEKITPSIEEMFTNQSYAEKGLSDLAGFSENLKREFDAITFWNASSWYGFYYLEDMINAFKFTNSDYITKDAYMHEGVLVSGREHNYVDLMPDKCRTMFWAESFTVEELLNIKEQVSLTNGYSIDHLNYDAKPREVLSETSIANVSKSKVAVIVPVYNNGKELLFKAFSSLLRNTFFNDLEILLIDGGSTDGETTEILKSLKGQYQNVTLHHYDCALKLSISKLVNKGFGLAQAEYLTCLHPGNEATSNGYKAMLLKALGADCTLVVGDMMLAGTECTKTIFFKESFLNSYGDEYVDADGKGFLRACGFESFNSQSILFNKKLLERNKIKQPENGLTTDEVFVWELFLASDKTTAIPDTVVVQYAREESPDLNTLSIGYFEDKYLLYSEIKKFLEEHELLSDYMRSKFVRCFEHEVLGRLIRVKSENQLEAVRVAGKILNLYSDVYLGDSQLMNKFHNHIKRGNLRSAFLSAVTAKRLW